MLSFSEFKKPVLAKKFGEMPDGTLIMKYHLVNQNGMELELIDYGATLTALRVPDAIGNSVDVVLGFDTLAQYIDSFTLPSPPYLGAAIGRFAGRINQGLFYLNNKLFQLEKNSATHTLHGGHHNFSQVVWQKVAHENSENPSVTFLYLSPAGASGFPGNLRVELKYTLTEKNEIVVDYQVISDQDTIINLTHHSYFNLDGHDSDIQNQDLFVHATQILEVDDDNIPTGKYINLQGHKYQFNPAQKCPNYIDNTFVLNNNNPLAASLYSPKKGIKMEVFTNQPAIHIYVGGNCFKQVEGKQQAHYHALSGICFEAQNFPDAPNHEHFPNCILRKNDLYQHQTIYKFQNLFT